MNLKEKERDGFNFFNKINRINKNEDYYYSQDYQEKNIQTEEKERVVFNFFNKEKNIQTDYQDEEDYQQSDYYYPQEKNIQAKMRSFLSVGRFR
ncbi:uncharacterized protein OCT59_017068 [Rhizophagus irregularis]|uniref:uncharacterized protein n=1 Tax=Rhizophagus irregularis TaxID=588596 RepID=UPI0033294551|nr:hypothetical protein OCT59_017068 [Rhizophagus irregularis]